jgi:RNA recognition motif-containing protein
VRGKLFYENSIYNGNKTLRRWTSLQHNAGPLQAAFAQAGTVTSATIIVDKMTGRSKGFGFIEMSTDEEAQKAIEMFNGKDFEGRNLTVNEARPMTPRPPRSNQY